MGNGLRSLTPKEGAALDLSNSIFERVKEKGDGLSPKQVQLARHLINNYKAAAFQTITQIGRAANVSEATVVRLAASLDYSGFPEMLDDLQKIVQHELKAYETIRHTYKGDQLKGLNIIETVINNEQRNLTRLPENIKISEIEQVADMIYSADQVIIVGLYAASYLAQYFGYNLGKIKENVTTINKDSMDVYNLLLQCSSNTTVFMISLPRYPKKLISLGEVFRKKGASVIGITDSYLSPLKAVSTMLLAVPQQYTSFSDPGCAIMLLLQAITMEYLARNPDHTEESLQQFDDYVEQMKFF
jgi:DNA-binding MurR/RpiR family transcriptional regulator